MVAVGIEDIFAQGEAQSGIRVRGAVVVQVERTVIRVAAAPIRVEGIARVEVLVVPARHTPCSKPMPNGFLFPRAASFCRTLLFYPATYHLPDFVNHADPYMPPVEGYVLLALRFPDFIP